MTAALAVPAAKVAVSAVGSLLNGISNALDSGKAKAKKQADDFETVFLENMTEKLVGENQAEGPLGENGTGGGIYKSMLTQEYARKIQQSGGLGLSQHILRDLLKLQEQSGGGATPAATTTAAATTGATNVGG